MIETLLTAYRLKDEERRGWVLRGVAAPESVADHTWGTMLLCFLHAGEAGVERGAALEIALAHDLAEALVGDVASRLDPADREMSLEEKARREAEAIVRILPDGAPGSTELRSRWREYEDRASPEALFVRDMNLVDMCLQALVYEREERHQDPERLEEFFVSAAQRLSTGTGRRLFAEVEAAWKEAVERNAESEAAEEALAEGG